MKNQSFLRPILDVAYTRSKQAISVFDPLLSRLGRAITADCCCLHCLNAMNPDDNLTFLCSTCEAHLPVVDNACRSCGEPLPISKKSLCQRCEKQPPAYDQTHCSYLYARPLDQWIRQAKDRRDQSWIPKLSQLMLTRPPPQDWISSADAFVFVPTSRKRLLIRGYNPAEDLTYRLARHFRKSVHHKAIIRTRHTDQRGLNARERHQMLEYSLGPGDIPLDGQHLILIDDVMTTGSTAARVAEVLRLQGASRVSIWVLARTPSPGFKHHPPR